MSSRFETTDTPLQGLRLIHRKLLGDHRGYLERMFCAGELAPALADRKIVQINHTLTATRGTVRGLHFQYPPHAETKILSCLRGEVFDVAVDIRKESPTFLRWHSEILSADNHRTLLIPEGFAHGFQTLTDNCEMLYFHTAAHNPNAESALNAGDPLLNISWPETVTQISARDKDHAFITKEWTGVEL